MIDAMPGAVILRQGRSERRFSAPVQVVTAWRPDEVIPALRAIAAAVEQSRYYAVGFISYEAAAAHGLAVHPPLPDLPLLWFGFYAGMETVDDPPVGIAPPTLTYSVGVWEPAVDAMAYATAVARIKNYLAAGDTYQVNYTFPLQARFEGAARAFFDELTVCQPTEYSAFIDTGRFAICSVSPELFFELDGERLITRPMKGTAARGRTLAEDQLQIARLRQSVKNRAENLMIVDMLRNDLGRIAQVGSVAVSRLFEIEPYPTLLQMTSTVTARTAASIVDILTSLFPCASITGAPKVRTMQIIRELETQPRGVYTGAIGFIGPQRQARFNVAIRTVLIDRERRQARYGVGGGLVWDSNTQDEYTECLLKARVLSQRRPSFQLLESLLWEPDSGYLLLSAHLQRLADSAVYFNIPLDKPAIEVALNQLALHLKTASKIRLLANQDATFVLQTEALSRRAPAEPLRIGLARTPVDSNTVWLYHKTTRRELYEAARASRPDCDEVILWNERGELTEASMSNLALELCGEWVTPPVASGLLAGTFRGWLLATAQIKERILTTADLRADRQISLINSVRRWQAAILIP
ncbi:MAG: aminodeoxychorismate synthase component I [Candidatus Competibacteraceae bacterium]|nr:aminodeoxychorismate synthase component I [Candidatus Competibacteraceae bacterium]